MAPRTKTKLEDFKLDVPSSLREMIEDELQGVNFSNYQRKKPLLKTDDASIDELMQRVFEKIEKEALSTFHSNEPWALRNWALANILKDEIANEATDSIAGGLMEPVMEWQKESFDPVRNFRQRLQFSGKKDGYVRECMRAANWFVSIYGRKQRYTQAEILEFLDWLDKRYDKRDEEGHIIKHGRETSTYVTKVTQLKRFLESLPEDEATGRKQIIPFQLPTFPEDFFQPSFTPEQIDSIIYTAIMEEKPQLVLRIALATIYGCRCGEIANMSSEQINLDPKQPTVDIPTEKKGRRIPQPIPKELAPLFAVPLTTCSRQEVIRQIKRVCKKAGVPCSHGVGVHAIRRSVVTALFNVPDLKEIATRRFMRWSMGMGMGVMPRYVKTPVEVTDLEVLEKHPYVHVWRELFPFCEYVPKFQKCKEFTSSLMQFNKIAFTELNLDRLFQEKPHLKEISERLRLGERSLLSRKRGSR